MTIRAEIVDFFNCSHGPIRQGFPGVHPVQPAPLPWYDDITKTSQGFSGPMKRALSSSWEQQRGEQAVRKVDRKRLLNVIYFIDSERTRSFKLSLGAFYTLMGVAVTLVLWFFLSIQLLVSGGQRAFYQTFRVKSLMATIFDYQTRYDQVYEKAYPVEGTPGDQATQNIVAKEEDPREEDFKVVDQEEIPLAMSAKSFAPQQMAAKTAPVVPVPVSKPAFSEPSKEVQAILPRIEETALGAVGKEVRVKFAIRNPPGIERSHGFLWGVATFEKADGSKLFVTSPEGMQLDATGKVLALDKALRFNIRYYKAKSLSFRRLSAEGTLKQVQIFLGNSEGGQTSQTVPVRTADATPSRAATSATVPPAAVAPPTSALTAAPEPVGEPADEPEAEQ